MTQRVSSGVRALDRQLGGGVPSGKLVTLLAEPTSQAELFIEGFISERETVYLSTERAPTTVTTTLHQQKDSQETHTDLTVTQLDRDAPVIDAIDHLERVPDKSVLVIDPIESLECADSGQYRAFISELQATLAQTDSVAVLHALKHDSTPAQRHRTEYMSDLVLDLVVDTSLDSIETQLFVPKFRGGSALTDPIKIELTDSINVDTSRDIA